MAEKRKAARRQPTYLKQYRAVLHARQQRFDEFFQEPKWQAMHEAAHIRLLEIERLFDQIKGRREFRLFYFANQLLADGLCSIACANYQLAFYCLRSFLELSTAAVKFSAFEFELRNWEAGQKDIAWAGVSSGDAGVYSRAFANAFFPVLAEEHKHYEGLSNRAYRESSEYVHGNPSTHSDNDHSDERIAHWFSLFDAAATSVIYAIFVRYNSEIDLSEDTNFEVAATLREELGHFPGVTQVIERASNNG